MDSERLANIAQAHMDMAGVGQQKRDLPPILLRLAEITDRIDDRGQLAINLLYELRRLLIGDYGLQSKVSPKAAPDNDLPGIIGVLNTRAGIIYFRQEELINELEFLLQTLGRP